MALPDVLSFSGLSRASRAGFGGWAAQAPDYRTAPGGPHGSVYVEVAGGVLIFHVTQNTFAYTFLFRVEALAYRSFLTQSFPIQNVGFRFILRRLYVNVCPKSYITFRFSFDHHKIFVCHPFDGNDDEAGGRGDGFNVPRVSC